MRVKRVMYWRNLERMTDSPWRAAMEDRRSVMKGMSFVGSLCRVRLLVVAEEEEEGPEPLIWGA